MKKCGICNEHPAVNGGLCPGCHESMVGFESSSEGVVLRILKRILVAAEEGGLMVKQSDAIAFKIIDDDRDDRWRAVRMLEVRPHVDCGRGLRRRDRAHRGNDRRIPRMRMR